MSLLQGLGLSGVFGTTPPPNNVTAMQQYNYQQQGMASAYGQSNQLAQQQWANAMLGAHQKPQWVFNGVICKSAREMADVIWPNDCQEKTWFILKYE